MENKTVEMVVKDLLSADNQRSHITETWRRIKAMQIT